MFVRFTMKSRNEKTGPIPVSTTSDNSCPESCALKKSGCYAKHGRLALIWREVNQGLWSKDWKAFCADIAALPAATFWRHNQAGDLPGFGDKIDSRKLASLVRANHGRRGFTYTHKPVLADRSAPNGANLADRNAANRAAVAHANANGFTVNLSADTLAQADALASLGIAPVVVILDQPEGQRHDAVTPQGRVVVTCPATYRDDTTCASCQLCQRQRKTIVGFPAHGPGRKAAAAIART